MGKVAKCWEDIKNSFNIRICVTPNSGFMQADRHNYLPDTQHGFDTDIFCSAEVGLVLFVCAWCSCFIWQTRSVQLSGLKFSNLAAVCHKSEKAKFTSFYVAAHVMQGNVVLPPWSHIFSNSEFSLMRQSHKYQKTQTEFFIIAWVFFLWEVGLVKDYILITT